MKIQVKDIMTTPVVSTTRESNVAYARELMERKHVSAIPVVHLEDDKATVEGIVTRFDLCGITDEKMPITAVMTQALEVVGPNTSVILAANLMMERKLHHLVVVQKNRPVGIISSMDFVRLVSEQKMKTLASVIFV